jgi:ubiquinone/menaquinone biosynthesis C-methylase UbiE
MGCHGGFSLDEATRRSWYNPEDILRALSRGMVLADIGCGEGFFSLLAAKIVGETGRIYAVDIDALAIENLRLNAEYEGLKNIIAKVGAAEETVFCSKCVDFIFCSMVLHDFVDPAKVLQNARRMVKSNGRIVDLDWKKVEMPFGPPTRIRFTEEMTSKLLQDAGFEVSSVKDAGKYHYVVTAKPLP